MATFITGDMSRGHALYLLTLQDAVQHGIADHWPFPRWMKVWHDDDCLPIMCWLNQAYVDWYGVDPYKYIGHCDRMCWDDATAAAYIANDRRAIESPKTLITVMEPTPRGKQPEHRVRKFAFRIDTNNINGWGIYGECTPD